MNASIICNVKEMKEIKRNEFEKKSSISPRSITISKGNYNKDVSWLI